MLLYASGLANIPEELNEASAIDGAGVWARFWNITLPLLRSTIATDLLLITLATLSDNLENYISILTDGLVLQPFANSLIMAVSTMVLATLLAGQAAYPLPCSTLCRPCFFMPWFRAFS